MKYGSFRIPGGFDLGGGKWGRNAGTPYLDYIGHLTSYLQSN